MLCLKSANSKFYENFTTTWKEENKSCSLNTKKILLYRKIINAYIMGTESLEWRVVTDTTLRRVLEFICEQSL